jgi:hypothetical protein
VLTHPVSGTLKADHCVVVGEPQAPPDIGTAVAEAAREARDVLLIYYSGHGIVDDGGTLHLALSTTDPAQPRWSALSIDVLRREVAASPAAVKVLVLDCCFSGRAIEAMSDGQGVITGQLGITGTYTLTSSPATSTSYAPQDATYTAFTEALLGALRSQDPLTLDELFAQVDQHLSVRGFPRPQRRTVNAAGDVMLVKGPPPDVSEPSDAVPAAAVAPARPNRRRFLTATATAAAGVTIGAAWAAKELLSQGTSGSGSPPKSSASATVTAATSLRQPLAGHTGTVYSVAFEPGGDILASGSADRTIRLWNVTDPAHPTPVGRPLTGAADIQSVAFSPRGNLLAGGGNDKAVRLWQVTDPARPTPLGGPLAGHTDAVFSVAFNPDGSLLASGSADRTIRLWNVTEPARPTLVGGPGSGHTDALVSVAFLRDHNVMASAGADEAVRLWNAADPPAPVGDPLTGHEGRVHSVAFSPDGRLLASGGGDRTIRLWKMTDPAHPTPLGRPLTGHTDAVHSIAFSPDGSVLASGSADRTIRLWKPTR